MGYEQIKYEIADTTATITLNRPDAMNALTVVMMNEMHQAIKMAVDDPQVRSIVLTGEGRAFCAGLDLKEMDDRNITKGYVGKVVDLPAQNLIKTIENAPKPVIGKINGFCFTGGLELALSLDFLVVANESKFGDTHAKWGLRPTWGMSARLPSAVGVRKARELSFTARSFTGVQAEQWSLANYAVPRDELDAKVKSITDSIAENSEGSVAAFKDLYKHGLTGSVENGVQYELATNYEIADTAERVSGFSKR